MNDIATLKTREEKLLAEIEKVRAERGKLENLRESDPRQYIARLVYENKRNGGTYGYQYGEFGTGEYETADKVIETANGDIDVAAAFVTKFFIK